MLLSRNDFVSALFCETDRAQRLKMPLGLIELGIAELKSDRLETTSAIPDDALQEIVGRIKRILRCYDSVGLMGDEELVLLLPGCSLFNAQTLAERLRDDVFATPIKARGAQIHFKACYGVVSSGGRSPFVVLREVESALRQAQATGVESIECFAAEGELDPASFLIPVLQDELNW